jgi:phosphate-selective porin OprO/OprP
LPSTKKCALALTARYSELSLGRSVLTGGLADPNLWTNHAQMVDFGFNWYLNKFLKVYFDWEHAIFGSPVFYNTGRFQRSNDLYWLRAQVLFRAATARTLRPTGCLENRAPASAG